MFSGYIVAAEFEVAEGDLDLPRQAVNVDQLRPIEATRSRFEVTSTTSGKRFPYTSDVIVPCDIIFHDGPGLLLPSLRLSVPRL